MDVDLYKYTYICPIEHLINLFFFFFLGCLKHLITYSVTGSVYKIFFSFFLLNALAFIVKIYIREKEEENLNSKKNRVINIFSQCEFFHWRVWDRRLNTQGSNLVLVEFWTLKNKKKHLYIIIYDLSTRFNFYSSNFLIIFIIIIVGEKTLRRKNNLNVINWYN